MNPPTSSRGSEDMNPLLLPPFGAACFQFMFDDSNGEKSTSLFPFMNIQAALAAMDLGEELLHVAWELARWQFELSQDLSIEESRALLLLVLAVLINHQRGSTRLPIGKPALKISSRTDATALNSEETAIHSLLNELLAGTGWLSQVTTIEGHIRAIIYEHKAPAIIGVRGENKPLLYDPERCSLSIQRMDYCENSLATALVGLLRRKPTPEDLSSSEAAMAEHRTVFYDPCKLNKEQIEAVGKAITQPLAVVSGGPGTGKTSIIVAILRILTRLGYAPSEVALAAPTGKAANRMEESIKEALQRIGAPSLDDTKLAARLPKPQTLHRLLGYSPTTNRFTYHENNRLSERVVIVDEGSMLDLVLMERLVRALAPHARLVILGDADQLPSVDSGAVLRDLVPTPAPDASPAPDTAPAPDATPAPDTAPAPDASPAPDATPAHAEDPLAECTVRLRTSYRMRKTDPAGNAILTVARHILNGTTLQTMLTDAPHSVTRRNSPDELHFDKVEILESKAPPGQNLTDFMDVWWRHRLASLAIHRICGKPFFFDNGFQGKDLEEIEAVFEHLNSSRILCLTKHTPGTGTEYINNELHLRANDELKLEPKLKLELESEPKQKPRAASGSSNRWSWPSWSVAGERDYLPGEPVMMLRNDYERNIYNGDQGLILEVEGKDRGRYLAAVFPRGGNFVAFPLHALRPHLELSYAMTVHKSQGSEFDGIGLILPDKEIALLTREILYTAVTRSRKFVTLIGKSDMLDYGIEHRLMRVTGIREELKRLW